MGKKENQQKFTSFAQLPSHMFRKITNIGANEDNRKHCTLW